MSKIQNISFSAIKEWVACPHRFKLLYVDRVQKFPGNEFTTFGSAIHSVLEERINKEKTNDFWEEEFDKKLLEKIKTAYQDGAKKFDKNLISEFRKQGKLLIHEVIPALKDHFGEFEVIGIETQLYEDIEDGFKFKGFIDLVIKSNDKIHIIDYKSCSWGWDARKKSDKMVVYQLAYYKHYFSQKYDVDPNDIEVYFALLKRTAKKGKMVEIFRVSAGQKRIKNSLDLMNKVVYNCKLGKFMKNKITCDCYGGCQFRKTKWCP